MLRIVSTLLLSAVFILASDASGKWSGTFSPIGETDSRSLFMIFQQQGDVLTGSGGPRESEQYSFRGGKVDGDRLKFEVSADNGTFSFDLRIKGDEITGDLQFQREGETRTAKVSLKRAGS